MTHPEIVRALIALLSAFFVAMLSSTVVATALPRMMGDLNGDQTAYTWTITATLLANAATTPIFGKLADMYNKKVLVQWSIVVFVAGSVLAGFTHSVALLLVARTIQGVAMGALTAMAMAIMAVMIAPRERGRYSAYMAVTMGLATAGGPLLGGFLVDSAWGWRSTFFVPVPIAIVSLILIQRTLHLPHTPRKQAIDFLGAFLLAAGVTLILVWISFAGKPDYYDWISWQTAAMVGGGVIVLAAFVLVERRAAAPVISLDIISERTTALAIAASICVGVAMFASTSFLGQYFQVARGETPTVSGLLMLPMIAGNMTGSVLSGRLISATGRWRRFLILGTLLLVLAFGLLATIDHATSLWLIGAYLVVLGLGLGMLMQNLVLAVQNNVGSKDVGTASASVAFFRSFGGAVGVAVLGSLLGTRVQDLTKTRVTEHLAEQARAGHPVDPRALEGGGGGSTLDLAAMPDWLSEIVRGAYGDGMAFLFLITGGLAVLAFVAVLFIREKELRRTIDLEPAAEKGATTAPGGLADPAGA
ncbi:MFS transporter [Falsarthrobacter nasiphocae]|nr:MFS transporter [Falsarthrobacter nasiphocae]